MNKIERLEAVISASMERFESNSILTSIQRGQFTIPLYHSLLKIIFHQTFHSPLSFAKAGINTPDHHEEVRHYLLRHAGEEKDHYNWVLGDLKSTGYAGTMPTDEVPAPSALRYISLNYFAAERYPVARLGIAAVLESIGGKHGKRAATAAIEQLKLKPNQMVFFFGHGDTDVGHSREILEVLGKAKLSKAEWESVLQFAEQAGIGYYEMYEEAFKNAV